MLKNCCFRRKYDSTKKINKTITTNIEANWFGAGNDEVEDYNTYYVDLLAEYNLQNEWIQAYKSVQDAKAEGSSWFGSWFSSVKVTTDNSDEDDD